MNEYLAKMKLIFLIVIIFILTMSIAIYLINKKKRDSYLNAGEKWDRIVNELRRRK